MSKKNPLPASFGSGFPLDRVGNPLHDLHALRLSQYFK